MSLPGGGKTENDSDEWDVETETATISADDPTALLELQDLGSSQLIWDRHQGCMISVPARRHEEVTTECLLSVSWVLPECLEVPSNVKGSALHATAHHGAITHR